MNLIFDTHAHYDDEAFDADREALLASMPENGVGLIVDPGCDLDTSRRAVEIAEQYPHVYAAVGWHPENCAPYTRESLDTLRAWAKNPKVVAIGEIGLDYYWEQNPPRELQQKVLRDQLALAQELDLPVSVHDREAHAEMYELLRQYRPRGVLHCYSGSAEDAAWLTAQGMALGFGGAVTYKGAKRAAKVLAMVPHELAVLETDCPYMSPEPVRGTRNDSRNIAHVAAKIGEIWQMDAQSVLDLTAENAKRIFNQ